MIQLLLEQRLSFAQSMTKIPSRSDDPTFVGTAIELCSIDDKNPIEKR